MGVLEEKIAQAQGRVKGELSALKLVLHHLAGNASDAVKTAEAKMSEEAQELLAQIKSALNAVGSEEAPSAPAPVAVAPAPSPVAPTAPAPADPSSESAPTAPASSQSPAADPSSTSGS